MLAAHHHYPARGHQPRETCATCCARRRRLRSRPLGQHELGRHGEGRLRPPLGERTVADGERVPGEWQHVDDNRDVAHIDGAVVLHRCTLPVEPPPPAGGRHGDRPGRIAVRPVNKYAPSGRAEQQPARQVRGVGTAAHLMASGQLDDPRVAARERGDRSWRRARASPARASRAAAAAGPPPRRPTAAPGRAAERRRAAAQLSGHHGGEASDRRRQPAPALWRSVRRRMRRRALGRARCAGRRPPGWAAAWQPP
eukprot:scaffold3945_cov105-Isochrysis_galbana.AAC.17